MKMHDFDAKNRKKNRDVRRKTKRKKKRERAIGEEREVKIEMNTEEWK